MLSTYDETQSTSGADLLRLDESMSSISNLERSVVNRSRIDGARRQGTSRMSSAERLHPPVARSGHPVESTRRSRRSPSPAMEGIRASHSSHRRGSPSPMRFDELSADSS